MLARRAAAGLCLALALSGPAACSGGGPARPAVCTDERDPETGECAPKSLATLAEEYCISQHLARRQFEACVEMWVRLGRVPN